MRFLTVRFMLVYVVVGVLFCGVARSMTVQLGSSGSELIPLTATWRFLRGREPASAAPEAWTQVDFDDSGWETGPAGFGFGDQDDATVLDDMQGSYVTVYVRKEFGGPAAAVDAALELVIDYDDGFIAYLNGREVARRSIPAGPATYQTLASSHEAGNPETIRIGTGHDLQEWNVLAIEGHNGSLTSSDFSLIPTLRTASDTLRNGDTYIVTTDTVVLTGRSEFLAGKAGGTGSWWAMVGDVRADANLVDGTWRAEVPLSPGLNTITAWAFGGDPPRGGAHDSGSIEIIYVPAANHLAGELLESMTLAGAWVVDDTVIVPVGRILKIEPGTFVLMKQGVSIIIGGQLLAEGTEARPIRFTHLGDGTTWRQLMFVKAADSRLVHCIVEYADSAGEHQDYYEPGPRDYHEAVVALACHLDVNDCTFQKLPDDGAGAEGDALAVISDDPNHPGEATAHITGCRFLGIGQGVHTRYAYVLVEDCYFTGKHGDNDDVDLWGESTPPPLIRNNVFWYPAHDDAINPTRCSPIIVGNLIVGTDDHGIVLRDKGTPVVINNVVVDCANGGIAIENSNTATLINNTIVQCGRGLRLFDLGRWGPPYRLNPGGGTATVVNCIIWDCPTPITLADSSNTSIADRGSHVTVMYSDIQRGQKGVSVTGQFSTVTWGAGNIDADPLFVDPEGLDFHLLAGSPAIDAADTKEAPEVDRDGIPRPLQGGADMGAYEFIRDLPLPAETE
jgi:parallel beta-helix repeat protein